MLSAVLVVILMGGLGRKGMVRSSVWELRHGFNIRVFLIFLMGTLGSQAL